MKTMANMDNDLKVTLDTAVLLLPVYVCASSVQSHMLFLLFCQEKRGHWS